MNENKDAPTVVRRRRKIVRQQRDKTPDATKLSGICTDDESSSTTDQNTMTNTSIISSSSGVANNNTLQINNNPMAKSQQKPKSLSFSAHRSKILNKRDKGVGTSIVRSQSTPRDENKILRFAITDPHNQYNDENYDVDGIILGKNEKLNNNNNNMEIRPVKRSLSSPRNKEDPRDSFDYLQSSQFQREMAPMREIQPINKKHLGRYDDEHMNRSSLERDTDDQQKIMIKNSTANKLTQLEINLHRFEEERRKFDVEKKRFEREKREMDNRMRFKRFEDFERKRNQRRQLDELRFMGKNYNVEENQNNNNNDIVIDSHSQMYYDKEQRKHSLTLPAVRKKLDSSEEESMNDYYVKLKSQQSPSSQIHQLLSPPISIQQKKTLNRLIKFDDYAELKKMSNKLNNDDLEKFINNKDQSAIDFDLDLVNRAVKSLHEDYESSTAISSSSREGDFDDETLLMMDEDQRSLSSTTTTGFINNGMATLSVLNSNIRRLRKSLSKSPIRRNHQNNNNQGEPWYKRLLFFNTKKEPKKSAIITNKSDTADLLKSKNRSTFTELRITWKQLLIDHPTECIEFRLMRNRCISNLILIIIYFGIGGMIFRFVEGAFENFYKCGVRRVKRDFVDHLWLSSHNLREEDWKSIARLKLRQFEEELHTAHEAGMTSYSGMKSWSFINGILYCMSVITTIGYGHITPVTSTGRAITIVYAIIGIPMFLILLADFGKLFTRGIKFVWAYVRRLYYTGSLRKVRKQAQVQGVLRGMNMAYEIATFRRPSMMLAKPPDPIDLEHAAAATATTPTSTHLAPPSSADTPTTPMPPEIDIDDEFNLPISLAFIILLAYIFCGAAIYKIWEKWSFFDSCYFVFVSMSTIGFGDLVPKHPIFMMASIIYLVFGLALTSMCINVVQVKLSDSFRQASAKIGATIGLSLAEEEARSSQNASPCDAQSIHSSIDSPGVHRRNDYSNDDSNNNNNNNNDNKNSNNNNNADNNNTNNSNSNKMIHDYDNTNFSNMRRKNSNLTVPT